MVYCAEHDMDPYTGNKELDTLVAERMATLDPRVKRILESATSATYIENFAKQAGIDAEKTDSLKEEIILIMLGFTALDDFAFILMTELEMPPRLAFEVEHWVKGTFLRDVIPYIGEASKIPETPPEESVQKVSSLLEVPPETASVVTVPSYVPTTPVHIPEQVPLPVLTPLPEPTPTQILDSVPTSAPLQIVPTSTALPPLPKIVTPIPVPIPIKQVPSVPSVASPVGMNSLEKTTSRPHTMLEDVVRAQSKVTPVITPSGIARYNRPLVPTPAYVN